MPDTPEHQLPLHIAVYHKASLDTIKIIYDAYPDAVKCHTKSKGFIPIHMACCHKDGQADVIRFLLDKYPYGAKVSIPFNFVDSAIPYFVNG